MNIVEQGYAFFQWLLALVLRTAWDWRRCPHCGETQTSKAGGYRRHVWTFAGRQTVRIQRHRCQPCGRTYSEGSAWLVGRSWYAREVHRAAIDHLQHVGSSVRRTAEWLRSWLGRQERWHLWRPLDPAPAEGKRCRLSGSTVQRWVDRAGRAAKATVADQLAGVPTSGQVGTDGLWARLRGKTKRVVLLVVDTVTGVIWPPVVVGDEGEASWERLFKRAKQAGLNWDDLRGVVSDGAVGLGSFLDRTLSWVNHQRCVFHLWRNLGGELAQQASAAAVGLTGAAATAVRKAVRRELVALVHGVLDAPSEAAALAALVQLAAHERGAGLAKSVGEHLDAALVYLLKYNRGLCRVGPEWCWRDYRRRLSRGRNAGSDERLERTALVWAIYRNFEPAQWRSERKRHYRYPGQSPLAVAGVPPNGISYLDALGV